jgi:dTDP-glucose 4,6-dehydratase
LVTGGAGFIGINFVHRLLADPLFEGKVINLDILGYASNQARAMSFQHFFGPDRYLFVKGDICNEKLLESLIKEHHIDAIVHFAAQSHVDRSIHSPRIFAETNVIGTLCLLDAAIEAFRRGYFKLFHHISTDEVFGEIAAPDLFTEASPYRPNSPYSASKAASDHFVRAYHRTYGLPVTISNCSNNYGPYQHNEKLIPKAISSFISGVKVGLYGDGSQVRDWLHVEDHCAGIWKVLTQGVIGETYCFGGGTQMTNRALVEMLADGYDQLVGNPKAHSRKLITLTSDRPGHDQRYAIDAAKAQKVLNWVPQVKITNGIEKTIQHYLRPSL